MKSLVSAGSVKSRIAPVGALGFAALAFMPTTAAVARGEAPRSIVAKCEAMVDRLYRDPIHAPDRVETKHFNVTFRPKIKDHGEISYPAVHVRVDLSHQQSAVFMAMLESDRIEQAGSVTKVDLRGAWVSHYNDPTQSTVVAHGTSRSVLWEQGQHRLDRLVLDHPQVYTSALRAGFSPSDETGIHRALEAGAVKDGAYGQMVIDCAIQR